MKYTSLSVRVWEEWMELVRKAAEKADITVPEFVRDRLAPIAAKELGIPVPNFPPFVRGRPSPQTMAAHKMKMPVEQWRKAILDRVAAAALGDSFDDHPPPPRRRVPSSRPPQ